ncbi:hypothetical protein MASR1M65_27900 [Saprospiraceae bacterium]
MSQQLYSKITGQGPPVIILHGLLGTSDNWHSIAANLAEHYTVCLLDLRNHGRSFHSHDFNYELHGTRCHAFYVRQLDSVGLRLLGIVWAVR